MTDKPENAKIDQYAVMGNPIGHSKSPFIHTMFAAQTGQRLEYRTILVELGNFARAAEEFRDAGGKGLNITVPFKQDAWIFIDEFSPRAERAGAVNTILFHPNGSALGENTDGLGLVRDLTKNHSFELKDKRILLLGAGGATRGVMQPLLVEQPASLVVANRTPEKAAQLALLFGDLGRVSGGSFDELKGRTFDLIINATSAGLEGKALPLPEGILADGGWCYDMVYGDEPTVFMHWAEEQGANRTLDGLGMLVEQAAESFKLWRGVRPETEAVIAGLRG